MGLYLCNKYFSNNKIIHVEEHNYNSFHAKKITCLLTLKDGRLALSHEKGIFIIYNNEDLTKIDLSLKFEYSISSFIQLYDEKIIICSKEKNKMTIIKLNNKNQYEIIQEINISGTNYYSNLYDFKVIESKNDEFIVIYRGNYNGIQMTRWKLNKNNKYELCTLIKERFNCSLFGFLKLNEEEFVVVEEEKILSTHPYVHEEKLVFRAFSTLKKISVIGNVRINRYDLNFKFLENICFISKNIFSIWEEYDNVLLINITTHSIVIKLDFPKGDTLITKFYSLSKFSEDIFIIFASLGVEKVENPIDRRNDDDHYIWKNYMFLEKINEKGIKEIFRYECNDQYDIFKIGTKVNNNFIATCQKNKIELIKIKI